MDRIQLVVLIVGALILVTRAPGLFNPRWLIRWIKRHITSQDDAHLRYYGFAIVVIGAFLLYILSPQMEWIPALSVTLALIITMRGLVTLASPGITRSSLRAAMNQPHLVVWIWCLAMTILAVYMILYGLGIYNPQQVLYASAP